ncbi:MAG: putative metal-dependent HD superfamily phosphohydrolase [Gammaproteobacteria bacterium]|jgi:predicted metal-dependent HD superfamily phosphohydrolase
MSKLDTVSSACSPDRFRALWKRQLQANRPDHSDVIYQQIVDAYAEPQRVYHTLEHIENCLAMFDQVSSLVDTADSVELAIWFHDVIYQIGDCDNEQLSADLFMALTEGLFEDEFRKKVYQLIMATRHNFSPITDHDTQLMVDIDLSSFGLPWPDFLRDSEKVRGEMQHLSDTEYYEKQAVFQQALLEKPQFFKSDFFYDNYETQARSNLAELFKIIKSKK